MKKPEYPRNKFDKMNKSELLDYIKKYNINIRFSSELDKMTTEDIKRRINDQFAYAEEIEYTEAAHFISDEVLNKEIKTENINTIGSKDKCQNISEKKTNDYSAKQKSKGVALSKLNNDFFNNLLIETIKSALAPFDFEYKIILIKDGCKVVPNSKSIKQSIFTYNRVTFKGENMDVIKGNFYFNPLKGVDEVKTVGGEFINSIELSYDSKRPKQVWISSLDSNQLPIIFSENNLLNKMCEKLNVVGSNRKNNHKNLEQKMLNEEHKSYNNKPL